MASEQGTRSVPGLIALGGVVLVAGTAAAWLSLTGGSAPEGTGSTAAPTEDAAATASAAATRPPRESVIAVAENPEQQLAELLTQAQQARLDGTLFGSDGAFVLYRRALDAQPDSAIAREGMNEALTAAVANIRAAINAGEPNAQQALAAALAAAPEDPRLMALQSELAIHLRLQPMLDRAAELAAAGRFMSEDGSEAAVPLYRAVLTFDPRNVAAARGLREVQARLDERFAAALRDGDTDTATAVVRDQELAGLDSAPNNRNQLRETIAAAQAAATQPTTEPTEAPPEPATTAEPAPAAPAFTEEQLAERLQLALLAEQVERARSAQAAGRLAPPDEANAWDLLGVALQLDAGYQPALDAIDELHREIEAQLEDAIAAGQAEQASRWLQAANTTGVTGDRIDTLREGAWEVYAAQARDDSFDHVKSLSQLEVVRQVPPEYPAQLGAGASSGPGVVDVQFTINEQGRVSDSEIAESTLGQRFNRSALRAIDLWRFEPYRVAGRPVAVRAQVRFAFD